jgi:hypothetical protein
MGILRWLALAALLSPAVQAQQGLPPPVKSAIEESRSDCDGQKLTVGRGFITRRDINGDKIEDFILNYEHAACGEEGLRFAEMTYLSEGQIPEEVGHGAVL